MGRIKGRPHTKKRVYLTDDQRIALGVRYESALAAGEFLTQTQLGLEFGLTQRAVGKILNELGVRTRTREEASPTAVNVTEAARIYLENPRLRLYNVAELYDVGWQAVRDQLRKLGVPIRPRKEYHTYEECDRKFFAEVDSVRAYFAGFIAADGYISTSGRALIFGIHPKDVEIFHNLQRAATLDQPIIVRANSNGKVYSWLSVCSVDWVRDLEKHYNIVNHKSLILKPPNLTDERLIWHFIRGVFDGDGHASKRGNINFISASPKFFAWLCSFCGQPGHIQTHQWLAEDKETYHSAQSAFYTTLESSCRIAHLMYKDSTPETRLERKYLRLARHFQA